MPLVTGNFWNTHDPDKPSGVMSFDADLVYPIELAGWLSSVGGTLKTVTAEGYGLFDTQVVKIGTVAMVRVSLPQAKWGSITPFTKYPFTVRYESDDASGNQKDSRSFWLSVLQR